MPATNPADLLQPCYQCLGMSIGDALLLSLWQGISENVMACNGALENMTSLSGATITTYVGDSTINFNSLSTITGRLIWTQSPGITAFNFPVLTAYGGSSLGLNDNTALATVFCPFVFFANTGILIDLGDCALTAASVEMVLARGVASGLTTATLDFAGGGSAGLSSLSPQGVADHNTLVAAGCTVLLNA